jgi:hypothetical protein
MEANSTEINKLPKWEADTYNVNIHIFIRVIELAIKKFQNTCLASTRL